MLKRFYSSFKRNTGLAGSLPISKRVKAKDLLGKLVNRHRLRLALQLVIAVHPIAGTNAAELQFVITTIRVDGHSLAVELADTAAKRQRGLMRRTQLPDGTGMLFEFEQPQYLSFWMKDTPIDLDIGFFGEDRRLQQIETMRALDLTYHRSKRLARYALEVPRDWYTAHDVRVGAQLTLPTPP